MPVELRDAPQMPALSRVVVFPVGEDFCRVSIDSTKSSRRVVFRPAPSHTHPTIRIAFVVELSLTLQETNSNTHDILPIRPDLKVYVFHSHRSDSRQKLRTVVGLLTPRQSGRAIPVIINTEEDSTARPSESRILIAYARTLPLFGVPPSNLASARTLSAR